MTDKIVDLQTTRLAGHVRHVDDQPRLATTGDNFSPADAETLARLGLDPSAWPRHGVKVSHKALRDIRDDIRALSVAHHSIAIHLAELDGQLTDWLGEDTEPGDEPA